MASGLTQRFARAYRILRLPTSGPLLVAASGGADSAAALVLLRAVAPHVKIVACYVDHGLRPRASISRDVAAVRAQTKATGASLLVRRIARGARPRGSPEELARVARYQALAAAAREAGAGFVITGHQQDDLAETSLLALVRGAGIDGVAALRPLRALAEGVTLARPLLWATKAQCRALLAERNIPYSNDETNDDTRIPRNAVRALLAGLERSMPGSSRAISRSAALLADDKALLDGLSAAAWQSARSEGEHLNVAVLRRMPVALLRRVIRHAIAASGASLRNFSYEHCDAIAMAIKDKRGGRYHAGQTTIVLSSGKLIVQASEARPADEFSTTPVDLTMLPREIMTPLGRATFRSTRLVGSSRSAALGARAAAAGKGRERQLVDLAALRAAGGAEIRVPRKGDTCIPSGRTRPVSLARFLGKAGMPNSQRGTAPLLCAGGRIAAVLGLRVMEPFEPKGQGPVLEVGWRPTDS